MNIEKMNSTQLYSVPLTSHEVHCEEGGQASVGDLFHLTQFLFLAETKHILLGFWNLKVICDQHSKLFLIL